MSFLILALPRSRTAWLAHYLSYPLARPLQPVGHDIMRGCDSVEKFLGSYKNGMWGTCETGGTGIWRIVRQEMPECKIVLIRRPIIESHRSLLNAGFAGNLTVLAEQDVMLDAASTDPEIVSIPYNMLSEPFIGKWLFESLLELEADFDWWIKMVNTNVQMSIHDVMPHLDEYAMNLTKLSEEISNWKITKTHLN